MPYHPLQEPTYRKPLITARLNRDGFSGGLNLPMHKYIRGLNMQWGTDANYAVTIRMFDPEYDTIERFLHAAGLGTEVYYSFGWRDGEFSPEYYGLVKQYASKFLPGGNEIEFTVQSPQSALSMARPEIVFGVQRVDDAVNFVCKELGIPENDRIIEPTIATPFRIPDILGRDGDTFSSWLGKISEMATSARGNDYGAYTWAFDPDGTFRFTTTARRDGVNMRLYDAFSYGFASDGRIIDFELMDIRPQMTHAGGDYVVSRTINPDDPIDQSHVTDTATALNETPTESPSQGMPVNQSTEQGLPSDYAHAPTDEIVTDVNESILRGVSRWRLYTGYNYKVNMTILGDPHIRIGDFVYVRIVKRDGTPHFMSGLYHIINVIHDIDESKFTTALLMLRRGSFIGDTLNSKVVLPASVNSQLDRNLPGLSVSPAYRFQLGRYYYSETLTEVAIDEDDGEYLELSPKITMRLPSYEPPIPGTEGAPFRHDPVESEEEE